MSRFSTEVPSRSQATKLACAELRTDLLDSKDHDGHQRADRDND
jgi:hypothetical protein